jgi:hypothetical protein
MVFEDRCLAANVASNHVWLRPYAFSSLAAPSAACRSVSAARSYPAQPGGSGVEPAGHAEEPTRLRVRRYGPGEPGNRGTRTATGSSSRVSRRYAAIPTDLT